MNQSDRQAFKDLMVATAECYQKPVLSNAALEIYFSALSRFEFEKVQWAVSQHIQNTTNGQFYPKVADLVRQLEGSSISHDKIIAMARLKNCPLGVLAGIQIGSWDLDNQTDMFYLRQRAEECIERLPEWKSRAARGEYSDHEISMMLKHDIDPAAPFHDGLPAPACAAQLAARVQRISCSPRHLFLIEPPYVEEEGDKKLVAHGDVDRFINDSMSQ